MRRIMKAIATVGMRGGARNTRAPSCVRPSMTHATAASPTSCTPQPASGRAIAALVLGLLGLFTCQLLSPFAWVLGWMELREIDAGTTSPAGRDCATVGLVLGIIGSAMLAIAVL